MRNRVTQRIDRFDAHMHLNDPAFAVGLGRRIDELAECGYAGAVSGWDFPSSERALELASAHSNFCATVGFHPCFLPENLPGALAALSGLAKCGAAAIGECGLDETSSASPEFQREALEAQLDLACSLGLPAVLHVRGRHGAMLEVLRSRKSTPKLLLHGASLSRELLCAYLETGCMISLGGLILRRGAKRAPDTAKAVPPDRLMIETDCPYQPPMPGMKNEPENLLAIAFAVAESRETDAETVLKITEKNARRFFGLTTEGME